MSIALYHFHVTQIKRSAGQSAIASAAYRSGEKLHSEYYGEDSDYTKKGGVICSEILLPPYALRELVKGVYIEAPDKSSGKWRQNIRISYDLVGFIPLNELMKEETA